MPTMTNDLLLTIQDFQGIKYLEVPFLSPVTSLVGPTDAGKSSVVRALYWLRFNRPQGLSIVRRGAAFARVSMTLPNGTVIARERGKNVNRYLINDRVLTAVGSSVPDEVATLLDLDAIHFQLQDEPPFWFGLTPGQVSKALNTIVNLDAIDRSVAHADSRRRAAMSEAKHVAERLAQAKAKKQSLSWTHDAEERILAVVALREQTNAAFRRRVSLTNSLTDALSLITNVERSANAILALAKAIQTGDKYAAAASRLKNIRIALSDAKKLRESLSHPSPDLSKLETLATKWKVANERRKRLQTSLNELRRLKEQLCQTEKSLKAGSKELEEATKGECPLCGRS